MIQYLVALSFEIISVVSDPSLFSLYLIHNKLCTFHFIPYLLIFLPCWVPSTQVFPFTSSVSQNITNLEKKNNYDSHSNGYSGKYSSLLLSQEMNGLHSILSLEVSVSSLQASTIQQLTAVKSVLARKTSETTASAESSDLPSILHIWSLFSTWFVGTVQPFDWLKETLPDPSSFYMDNSIKKTFS